jgi:hypothetical protein
MPSWEEIVDRVTVKGNYFNVQEAARGWERVFQRLDELRGDLEDLSKKSESWTGGAADAFRGHLKNHIDLLGRLADDHRRIVHGLDACHDHLKQAVNSIEIPTWMYSEVESKQLAYHQGGEIPGYSPGSFGHGYLKYVMGDGISSVPLVGDAWKALDGWIRDREASAQTAYANLVRGYGGEYQNIPEGNQQGSSTVAGVTDVNPTGPSGVGSPGLGHGTAPQLRHGSAPPGFAAPHTGGEPSVPGGSDVDPGYGGLAGSTPGGFTGAGPGAGGLAGIPGGGPGGAMAGGGAGLGGLGAGALAGGAAGVAGRGLPSLGPSVAPTGLGGAAGGPGAGGRGSGGRGTGSRGGGMLGGGQGGGHGYGDDDGRSTWLQEDDDVWGAGNNAPPPVIGG